MESKHFEKSEEKKSSLNTICILGIMSLLSMMVVVIPATATPAISAVPSYLEISQNDTFTINITVDPAGNEIYAAQYDLFFDMSILNATSQSQGTFLSQDGASTVVMINKINNTIGKIEYGETRMGVENGVTTPGVLASITFKAIEPGTNTLNLSNVILSDSNGSSLEIVINGGTVVINGEQPPASHCDVYFRSDPASIPEGECHNVTVQILINCTETVEEWGTLIAFDYTCVNITDVEYNKNIAINSFNDFWNWNFNGLPYPDPNYRYVMLWNFDSGAACHYFPNGTVLANLTVHCENASYCESPLNFYGTDAFRYVACWGVDRTTTWHNGTVIQGEPAGPEPDLIPIDIKVKHNYYDGAWANLNNTVDVTVENNGAGDAGSFDVKLYAKLYADYEEVGSETVSNLPTGDSSVVNFLWKPSDSEVYDLKVVVDSESVIAESDEANNEMIEFQYVGYNGYMGDKPFTTYAHEKIKGELIYTWGDSYYSSKIYPKDSGYTPYNYAVNFDITIPEDATIKLARLYNYWTWSYKGSSGVYPDMRVTFNDTEITPDKKYDDRKGWGSAYNYPTGTYCYNVAAYITGSGTYTAYIENIATEIYPPKTFCMDGFGLLVVYEDTSGREIEYWINEGCDMLSTQYASGGVTPEEATTNSTFTGTLDITEVKNATLWTVVQSGGDINDILIFNDCNWTGAYDATPYSDLDVDEREVTGCLNSSDNLVQIRAAAYPPGGYLSPSNAFLVVEYKEEEIFDFDTGPGTYPSISGVHKGNITPKHDIVVEKMYTYPCAGTGGHSESVRIYGNDIDINGTWNGYHGDYHNLTFPYQFTLLANHTYNYTIRTGSYPRIHHTAELEVDGGTIRCTEFIDANRRIYNDWIPAIRLYYQYQ